MFYHVKIEIVEKERKSNYYKKLFELDKSDVSEIENDVVLPYLQNKPFQFDGYFLQANEIKRVIIKQSEKTTEELAIIENDNVPPGIVTFVSRKDIINSDKQTIDITKQVFANVQKRNSSINAENEKAESPKNTIQHSKVFIVHGHDDFAKTEVARFVEKMGFEPIILHEQVSSGNTIIEKIETYSNVGFGIVLYTPCDIGAKFRDGPDLKARARQNVVFEHGFLYGKLGRQNVCALVKGDIETPNDLSGVVYLSMDGPGAWKLALAKEMRNSGYNVDMNKIF